MMMQNPQGEDGHDDNSDASSTTSSVISLKSISAAEDEVPGTGDLPPNQMQDKAFNDHINQIWMTYDEDKKGALDKDEAKSFVRVAMSELGSDPPSKEEIEEDFEAYDSAKTIEQSKIVEYIRKRLIADKILKEPVSSPPEVKENK
jgi:hypothetical protein